MKSELEDKLKILETAEKLSARKTEILQMRFSIGTLLDEFTMHYHRCAVNRKNGDPQALRLVFKSLKAVQSIGFY